MTFSTSTTSSSSSSSSPSQAEKVIPQYHPLNSLKLSIFPRNRDHGGQEDQERHTLLLNNEHDEEKFDSLSCSPSPCPTTSLHRLNSFTDSDSPHDPSSSTKNEFSAFKFAAQAAPSLLLSVTGGALTGQLLETAQSWPAFVRLPELYILLPILMNLKGNLEMNLTTRLSTSVSPTWFSRDLSPILDLETDGLFDDFSLFLNE